MRWLSSVLSFLGLCLLLSVSAWGGPANVVDVNADGIDDETGLAVQEFDRFSAPMMARSAAGGPVHVLHLSSLGIGGRINAATWQSDGQQPSVNGATGFLWIACSQHNYIYQIDTTVPAIRQVHQLPYHCDGLGWDGRSLLCNDLEERRVFLVDPADGQVLGSFPVDGGWLHGISWKPDISPEDNEYVWLTDFSMIYSRWHQCVHGTGDNVFTNPAGGSAIGSLTDGWRHWTSDFTSDAYYQYDIETGHHLATLAVGSVNSNPRDGTWDGHHLWDVSWRDGGWLWQWDLYQSLGIYDVTAALNPKHQLVDVGDSPELFLGLKNHTADAMTFSVTMEFRDAAGSLSGSRPMQISVPAGQVLDLALGPELARFFNPGANTVRAIVRSLDGTQIHEDWAVLAVSH